MPPYCKGDTPWFLFICFFLNECRSCKCIFCLSFLVPLKGTYPYFFKYKLNCRPTPNKTSAPQRKTLGKTPVVNVLSATTIEEPTSQSSNPKPSQSISLQQMLTEDSGASTSPAPFSRSTSTKPSVPDINATHKMINDLFSADEVVHSFYHCTETTCNYQKEKGKKKFDHAWIFRRDLTHDATTGLWWLLFIKEKGMYCLLCRLHQARGKHNKSASYGMEPAVRFQTSALVEHCSGQKHQDSIAAEMIKRTSIFQEKLDERNLHRHEILYSAFMSLYWHGFAYRNFPSMLKMMRTIGLEKLEHFQHKSLWSVRGILTTMGRVKKITKAAKEAKCYGLMVDEVTDIQV